MESVPLHPMFVHFPIVLWPLGSLWLMVAYWRKRQAWQDTAWIILIMAAVLAIPASITGQNELMRLGDVTHQTLDQHRDLGNLLPWVMGAIVLLYLHDRFKQKKTGKIPWWFWVFCCILVSALIIAAGWTGGHLVYLHGFGYRG